MEQALAALHALLERGNNRHVLTPNSEMLVEAARNPLFRSVLRRAALNLPDSAGLLWAARHTGQRLPERVTGVDTVQRLCAELDGRHSVFLLGAAPGVAQKAAEELRRRNPRLRIAGTHAGSPAAGEVPGIVAMINAAQPHVLLVAFGAPAQDLWIEEHLWRMPSVRIAMGVGGTFDFLAGKRKRAPLVFRRLSLEWLWRLAREPRRWRRIWTAVVVFPWMVLRESGREKQRN